MSQFSQSRQYVLGTIEQACHQAHRPIQSVQLLAVSKMQSSHTVEKMYEAGQRSFGENYLQEALTKIKELEQLAIEWHFIGHVQRNKTKLLAENFAWVHGVDRLIIAERLSKQRPSGFEPLNLCIQVNIDHQESKDGCNPQEVAELVNQISQLPYVHLRGLMVIPAPHHTQAFKEAQDLFHQVKKHHHHPKHWDTLSMGMSGDLTEAIAAGSTLVRVGTALFGARS